jgi:putative colanic acid biosynthesis UDP-glucose lipid carrier transferase
MKHSTSPVLNQPVFKKIDPTEVMEVVHECSSIHTLYVDRPVPLEKGLNAFLKRAIDLVFSFCLLIFLFSWMVPILALLIKIDSKGPVFFLQKRNKRQGKLFTCIKFRTMHPNPYADMLPAYEADQRITALGRILRKHHIDELPQLINVLMGDMSLTGPRPYMICDNEKYENLIDEYRLRFRVKPGITGLAQASGHFGLLMDTEQMNERVKLDLHYVRNWSVKMEAVIIYRTIKMAFSRQSNLLS